LEFEKKFILKCKQKISLIDELQTNTLFNYY